MRREIHRRALDRDDDVAWIALGLMPTLKDERPLEARALLST
jgi:hypothetical protein